MSTKEEYIRKLEEEIRIKTPSLADDLRDNPEVLRELLAGGEMAQWSNNHDYKDTQSIISDRFEAMRKSAESIVEDVRHLETLAKKMKGDYPEDDARVLANNIRLWASVDQLVHENDLPALPVVDESARIEMSGWLDWAVNAVRSLSDENEGYMPASWFSGHTDITQDLLRQAVSAKRKHKKVRSIVSGGNSYYFVKDVKRNWPDQYGKITGKDRNK